MLIRALVKTRALLIQHAAQASLNVRSELQFPSYCCWSEDRKVVSIKS